MTRWICCVILSLTTCHALVSGAAPTVLSLGGVWKVTNSNKSINVEGRVPGGIFTDLMRASVIGDPYFEDNDVKMKWVGLDNWAYRKTFSVNESFLAAQSVNLVCHGLDTVAKIYLNGNLVGMTNNMFVRYVFDVKNFLITGNNSIEVSFQSAVSYAKNQYNIQLKKYLVPPTCPPPAQWGECHVNFIRKIQSSFSWDWGPSFATQGIWKGIELVSYDAVIIRDVTVATIRTEGNENSWQLKTKVFFELSSAQQTKGNLRVILNNTLIWSNQVEITFNGNLEASLDFNINISEALKIKKWWPAGYGEQNLYRLRVEYVDSLSGQSSDKTITTGFRTIELVQHSIQNATGATFYFRVNGVPVFLKGSNWIPADSFQERITSDYLRHLLTSTRDCNMNSLRVWGGGAFESDEFYQIADELGILLWHDLLFACSLYPVDQPFLDSVSTEATQQIRRLQHHPSILLWAGNNENEGAIVQGWWPQVGQNPELYKSDYRKLYITTLMTIVNREDPARTYLPSSPSNGIDTEAEGWIAANPADERWGDVHVYKYFDNGWDWSIYPIPRFASEYGFQSYPSFETLKNVSKEADWTYPSNEFIQHRQHSPTADLAISSGIRSHLFLPNNTGGTKAFKDNIYLSQIVQAMAMKTESEHYRRYRSHLTADGRGLTMGALYWQLNDIWQAPSWASIEFGGRWKMLQYFVRNFFSPQLISPLIENNFLKVYLISDRNLPINNVSWSMEVFNWTSLTPMLTLNNPNVTMPAQESVVGYQAPLNGPNGVLKKAGCLTAFDCFFYFRLSDSTGNELSKNFLFPQELNTVRGLGKANIQITTVNVTSVPNAFDVTLTSDSVAPFVWLTSGSIPGEFCDNGFLMVRPTLVLQFKAREQTSAEQLKNSLQVYSLMDATS